MQDCDFIPDRYHEARTLRRALKVRAACVAMLIAIMGLWVVVHRHRLAGVEGMAKDVARQREQVAIHSAKKQMMEAQREKLQARQRLIEQLETGASVPIILGDVSRRMPETVVLTELSARCPSIGRYAGREEAEPPPSRPPPSHKETPPGKDQPADAPPDEEELPNDRIVMKGIARDVPEVIEFAAALETSPLFDGVHMQMKEQTQWAGRKAQRFELTCDLAKQTRNKQ